ncbi:hypothetical protein F5Y16DRAFT_120580 [Xylariaceae sp. FL0255]|nr:hypothetical protein F5Y16DRAFT_120580 [Xylariaceae sp. FL0255]
MEPHDVPDVPPPPYSETDIYSVSHHSYNNNNNDNINPLLRSDSGNHSHNVLDDAFSVAPSSSYSNPVIYTPPDSPSEASQHHQNTVLGDPPALSSFSSQSQNSNSAPIRTTPSAQSYFASRAVARQPNQALVTSYLSLTPESLPSDFPYPRDWAIGHAVTEQDWQTFLNHALPGHAARVDEVIVDRKIGIAASAASAASVAGDDLSVRGGHHDAKSSTGPGETGLSSASTAAGSGILGLGSGSGWSVKDIDAAIREWNQGFFGPRGITILRSEAAGSSSSSRGRQSLERERQQQQRDLAQQVEQQQQAQSSTPWWRTLVSMATEIATAPHQDRGPMAARMLSQHAFGSAIEERGGGRSRGRGRGRGQDFDGRWWYGQQQDPHHHSHDLHHDHRHDHDHHDSHSHSGPTKNIRRRRSRSSSTSSSSSSSSSSSDSSVGSLPDWDDLKDSQLPTARATVSAWLSHPDQPITKEAIKQAKASIKAAKNNNPPLGPATSTSTSVGSGVVVASNEDQARLRREVRQLMTDFKALKLPQGTTESGEEGW